MFENVALVGFAEHTIRHKNKAICAKFLHIPQEIRMMCEASRRLEQMAQVLLSR